MPILGDAHRWYWVVLLKSQFDLGVQISEVYGNQWCDAVCVYILNVWSQCLTWCFGTFIKLLTTSKIELKHCIYACSVASSQATPSFSMCTRKARGSSIRSHVTYAIHGWRKC